MGGVGDSSALGRVLRRGASFLPKSGVFPLYLVLSLVFPILIGFGCWVDGSWTMPGSSKGFSQYYGFWSIFATTPALLFLTSHLCKAFMHSIRNHEAYCVRMEDDVRRRVERLVNRQVQSLTIHSRSAWIFLFLMLCLFFWWLFNVVSTVSPGPFKTFGHDVFDSSDHPLGFCITKLYLLFVAVFVYAPAVFVALHVTASMISILRYLCKLDVLRVNFFHADNCGGTSPFGNINLIILSIYANFFMVIYAMYMTHRHTYLVMTVSLLACSLLAATQSVAAVYHIHRAVAAKKRECIEAVTERLYQQSASALESGGSFPSDLLAFRNHLVGIHTFPYAGGALVGINVIRFAPAVLALLSYFRPA